MPFPRPPARTPSTLLSLTYCIGRVSARLYPLKRLFIYSEARIMCPEMGLDLLARGIEQTQRRATILKWLCYASLALLAVNAVCWAAFRDGPRPTNQPLERTGPAA
jgi:hypothetical protein